MTECGLSANERELLFILLIMLVVWVTFSFPRPPRSGPT